MHITSRLPLSAAENGYSSVALGSVRLNFTPRNAHAQPARIAVHDDHGWRASPLCLPPDCLRTACAVRAPILAPTTEGWRLVEDAVSAAEAGEVATGRHVRRRDGTTLDHLRDASLLWIGNLLLAWGRPVPASLFRWMRAPDNTGWINPRSAWANALDTLEAVGFVRVIHGPRVTNEPVSPPVIVVPTARLLDRAGALGINPDTVIQHFGQPASST